MKRTWIIRVAQEDALAAAALRLQAGVEALAAEGEVWLRGDGPDEEVERTLRKIPCIERYTVTEDDRLVAWGARLPSARMPEGAWTKLREWIKPSPQEALPPGTPSRRIPIQIVRSNEEREASLLVTEARLWLAWAVEAPATRLRALRFALSADDRVAVRGTPVPPVRGRLFTEAEGIAVPCGFACEPAVEPSVLRGLLSLAAGDLALFHEDGSWEHVPSSAFVPASRSAARMSIGRA